MIQSMLGSFSSRLDRLEERATMAPAAITAPLRLAPRDYSQQNKSQPSPARQNNQATPTVAAAPSYAQRAAQGVNPKGPIKASGPATVPKIEQKSTTEPVRFVIRLNGQGPSYEKQLPPAIIGKRVNDILAGKNTHLKLLYARWNNNGNLILAFPYGANTSEIINSIPAILKTLALPDDAQVAQDTNWSKVIVSNVPTGVYSIDGTRFDSDQLLQELRESNPWVSNLVITQHPRWITKSENLSKHTSSFTFAFADHDGSKFRELTQKNLYMFATPVKVKKWVEKPLLKICERCQALDHPTSMCRRQPRCRICGDRHKTESHRAACKLCRSGGGNLNAPCTHPKKCANCSGPHGADDECCPKRALYRVPTTRALARSGLTDDMLHDA
jgi:hypothetical protein